ncbi:MAG: alcohol dehydrogenase catalytic domain-containing protein [Candidatus Dormibacteraceae bacterium]
MRFVEVAPGEVRLAEGPPPVPPPGWALVRVLACGLCGSDLRLARGMVLPKGVAYPLRPGHEVSGIVESLPQPTPGGFAEGDLVVLHPLFPCGECAACLGGQEQRCPSARVLGIHDPGGMAELVIWPVSRMLPAPALGAPEAALLTDAAATAYHALRLAALPARGRLCVLGAGGVGEQVLRLAQLLTPGVTLAAVVRSEASARRVRMLGAHVVAGLDGAAQRLRSEVGRFDAAIDFSGAAEAAAEGVRMLGPGGRLVVGSVGDNTFELGTTVSGVATRELQVLGCYVSTLADLRAVLKLAISGRLDMSRAVTEVLSLTDAPHAFDRLERRGEGVARLVLQP